jgi:hypothetical protein
MKYLFGDSTPFPLVENFLVTTSAATEACVAILRADELVEDGARQVREAEAKVGEELARLSALAKRIEETFGVEAAGAPSGSPTTDAVVARIFEHASATVKPARADVLSWREAAVLAAARSAPHAHVLPALSAFLVKHQLPQTVWSIQWRAGLNGNPTVAEVYSRTPAKLEGTFVVAVPEEHLWACPVRVGHFDGEATILLTRKRWLRDAGPCPERLDRLFITNVVHTPERASMTLRRSGRESSPGIEIVVRDGRDGNDASEMTAAFIERDGSCMGPPEVLAGDDIATVHRLWAHVESGISELVSYRSQLTAAKLGGVSVGEIAQPESVAIAILESISALVRDIAARSSNTSELSLKRQIADGRREELFIPYDAILGRTTCLSERHQALFDVFGLRSQSKAVVRKLPPPVPRARLKAVGV